MIRSDHSPARDYAALDEAALVHEVLHGDREAFRHVMQRSNQRLFRVARAVLNDEAEAEDVVQEAYVHAYEKLTAFRGDASLLTWLTRIVLNEAYGRLRRRRPTVDVDRVDAAAPEANRVLAFPSKFGSEDPAAAAARAQIRRVVEHAIEQLPEPFRVVFIMRELEECSVEETAQALDLRAETVKTRLHRARRLLRTALHDTLSATLSDAFPFLGPRCDRMTATVLARLDAGTASK
ncbi:MULTISPECIES: RNA polymerase sigma factor [unclassified Luteimonas]|uniref:RNA polymerase sigma factor n=1 Tax=unclassified Luteimonas TaxID=2629088 RepID=UPI0018F0E001|nr:MULTISPECIES: RNA polymerase sigma factor [unclassified Luteimonas]MBJ6982427.1 RNA polymerase sigma factor [Luteimonas sp. MC1572]MBJ7574995.1 RNA polymerase sigma factor [Luteimonas sp. MC1828]QQO03688.1 RNA polymerase sigma factor [Luteimonas sp. MC1572]